MTDPNPPAGNPEHPDAQQPAQPPYDPTQPYGQTPYGQPPAAPPAAPAGYDPNQPYGQPPAAPAGYDPNQPYGQPPAAPAGYDPNQPYGQLPAAPAGYDPNQPYGQPPAAPAGYDPNQPYAQQPGYYPGQQYAAPGQYGYGQPPAGPPPKSRKKLIIALIAAAVVVIAAVVVVLVVGGSSSSSTPDQAVTDYLTSLSKNDADGALAVVQNQPPSKDFLTDDVVTKQQAAAKITNIKVDKPSTSGGTRASVHTTYKFGTQDVDEQYSVAKSGQTWKVITGTVAIDVSSLKEIPDLQLFGKPVSGKGKVYVFPGPLAWSSANPDFVVTNEDKDKFATSPDDFSNSYFTLTTDLSDSGKQKMGTALKAYLDPCVASKSLQPAGCPQRVFAFDGVDGTATWTIDPASVAALKYRVSSDTPTDVDISGELKFGVTYQAKDFSGAVTNESDTDTAYLTGTVDLKASPAKFTPN